MMDRPRKALKPVLSQVVSEPVINYEAQSIFKGQGKDAETLVDHLGALDLHAKMEVVRHTKVMCSIGVASRDPYTLSCLLDMGMELARLNLSHGDHNYHAHTLNAIRRAVELHGKMEGMNHPLAVALDLKGPKIQTGYFEGGDSTSEVELKKGATVQLTTDIAYAEKGNAEHIYIDYPQIAKLARRGMNIFIDHGKICLTVTDVSVSYVVCVVEAGGLLGNQKGVQLPGVVFDLPALTTKDRVDLRFAVDHQVDIIFAPLVRTAATINEMRYILGEKGRNILIFSKIENKQGMEKLDEIMAVSDGLVVSRGELSTEMPYEKVVTMQKAAIARCNKMGKPVICGTQVLESMTKRNRVTRTEVFDVAMAVLDGADCLMLTSETETGLFPIEATNQLVSILRQAEVGVWQPQLFTEMCSHLDSSLAGRELLAMATLRASMMCRSAAIIVITKTGSSAREVSKFRPACPVIAICRKREAMRRLSVCRGILPFHYTERPHADWAQDVDNRARFGLRCALKKGFVRYGDHVIIVSGWRKGSLFTNTMRIMRVTASRIPEDAKDT